MALQDHVARQAGKDNRDQKVKKEIKAHVVLLGLQVKEDTGDAKDQMVMRGQLGLLEKMGLPGLQEAHKVQLDHKDLKELQA